MRSRNISRIMIATGKRTDGNVYRLRRVCGYCLMAQINEIWLWQRKMCHINFDNLVRISSIQVMRDLPNITKLVISICK